MCGCRLGLLQYFLVRAACLEDPARFKPHHNMCLHTTASGSQLVLVILLCFQVGDIGRIISNKYDRVLYEAKVEANGAKNTTCVDTGVCLPHPLPLRASSQFVGSVVLAVGKLFCRWPAALDLRVDLQSHQWRSTCTNHFCRLLDGLLG